MSNPHLPYHFFFFFLPFSFLFHPPYQKLPRGRWSSSPQLTLFLFESSLSFSSLSFSSTAQFRSCCSGHWELTRASPRGSCRHRRSSPRPCSVRRIAVAAREPRWFRAFLRWFQPHLRSTWAFLESSFQALSDSTHFSLWKS